jgi:retron-type reverse transcriptase
MNQKIIKKWQDFFEENNVATQEREVYLRYVSDIINNDVPVIFELFHFSRLLGIDIKILAKIINAPNKYYRKFSIPKRRGGKREIISPFPLLHEVQAWIFENILSKVGLHQASYGFVRGRSILDNAKVHLKKNELLTIDIKDFFGSINKKSVVSIFSDLGYSNLVSYNLASFCCLDDKLPQGACTSPALSNIIARRLDSRLAGLAKKLELSYTRYADDMSFSGIRVPRNVIRTIEAILDEEGFLPNKSKTKLKVGNHRKIVTGLLVSGDKVKVPKAYKRNLRKEIHYIKIYGLSNHLKKMGEFDPLYIERLIGRLNYILYIEPDSAFALGAKADLKNMSKNE